MEIVLKMQEQTNATCQANIFLHFGSHIKVKKKKKTND
jgi:hypothetical protein